MKTTPLFALLGLLGVIALFASCTQDTSNTDVQSQYTIFVSDVNNNPIPNVRIDVKTSNLLSDSLWTDSSGKASTPYYTSSENEFILSKTGYVPKDTVDTWGNDTTGMPRLEVLRLTMTSLSSSSSYSSSSSSSSNYSSSSSSF